jgi:hypothetical protein
MKFTTMLLGKEDKAMTLEGRGYRIQCTVKPQDGAAMRYQNAQMIYRKSPSVKSNACDTLKKFFLFIIVLGIHFDIYKSFYNILYLNCIHKTQNLPS